ncbi:hypothetical protein HN592_04535 [Candidatus Woesearchaeota archaeon]|jgi:aspartokinase|nr:hypothetical protein [Candidatus Woesearchaeota archaeon]MBT4368479.1 hypothetical protein [Candidatus Woesearchaeota archaeon]MBT4712968.1 hypothetical protein [Candidatus Woesearchaeota archaeon]MBT6639880.1 hypothetical protein [Candidatus Woesearchaeota archaeon]MBT7134052.1 hypothetical protein [Candidatus Woesearchaeota archaeon]
MKSTAEQTTDYIKEHPHIKSCLKKGLINYSALARLISKELNIDKKTSKEAILIAARRFQQKIKKEFGYDRDIKKLLSTSEIEVKNKINVYVVDKNVKVDAITLEGSENNTVIVSDKNKCLIEKKFKNSIIKKHTDLVLIIIKSSKDIESIPGVVAYITSLFSENGVNIVEFLSCWTDTLFVIEAKDLHKAIEFLKF